MFGSGVQYLPEYELIMNEFERARGGGREGEYSPSVGFDVSGSTLRPSLGRGEGGAAASQGHLH